MLQVGKAKRKDKSILLKDLEIITKLTGFYIVENIACSEEQKNWREHRVTLIFTLSLIGNIYLCASITDKNKLNSKK